MTRTIISLMAGVLLAGVMVACGSGTTGTESTLATTGYCQNDPACGLPVEQDDPSNNIWTDDAPGGEFNIYIYKDAFIKLQTGGDFEKFYHVAEGYSDLDKGFQTTIEWHVYSTDQSNVEYELGKFTIPFWRQKNDGLKFRDNIKYRMHNVNFSGAVCITRVKAIVNVSADPFTGAAARTEEWYRTFTNGFLCKDGNMRILHPFGSGYAGYAIILGLKDKSPELRVEQLTH